LRSAPSGSAIIAVSVISKPIGPDAALTVASAHSAKSRSGSTRAEMLTLKMSE